MADPKKTKKPETVDPVPPAIVDKLTDSVSSTAPATLTDSPPSSDVAPTADPEPPAGPAASSGTTVPTEGHQVSEQSKGKAELAIVQFLGPYQRYSRGDKAGFGADYAQDLVDRNVACWPKDFASKVKKNADDYPYAY
ncbi:hypothetical protein [Serratia fonticola]|uniref:hypothetical protein n=1 Tax=Serratia fonticola TaxID=47917 RepID=UPI0015C5F710|nr:hypothetical protein [Serratia fonticola]NYA15755.1 hypothetical protein [Serratia fonticola]NYA35875.1 hypothetical protein [Serratia fonticola]